MKHIYSRSIRISQKAYDELNKMAEEQGVTLREAVDLALRVRGEVKVLIDKLDKENAKLNEELREVKKKQGRILEFMECLASRAKRNVISSSPDSEAMGGDRLSPQEKPSTGRSPPKQKKD